MDDVGRLWQVLAALVAASLAMGFFTLCGNALLRLSESRVSELTKTGAKGKRIKKLLENSDVITQTNLAARTAIIIIFAVFADKRLYGALHALTAERISGGSGKALFVISLIAVLGISVTVLSALGVTVPKKLCTSGKTGEKFILVAFSFYRLFLIILKPLQLLIALISSAVLRIFGVKSEDAEAQVTEEEILQMLDAANENGGIEDDQAEMISNIFEFADMELHEVMTHRTEISAVEKQSPVTDAVRVSVETGVSRIPVYSGTIDNICGVLYVKDLLPLILAPESQTSPVSEYMHEIKYVPESGSCGELFKYFNENKKQIAVVLDEYGGTAGIVTMEDLLECIVGSIRDEYDENEAEDIEEITPNTFDILGGADPDDVMERLGHKLEEGDEYDTIGGFITDILGYIPADGETPVIQWHDITFAVIKAHDNRIEKIRAVKNRKKIPLTDEE